MVTTIIHNTTDDEFSVNGGNAGIYRHITNLAAGMECEVDHKPSATYRDYVLVIVEDGLKLFISPEHILQFDKISVMKKNEGGYEIKGRDRPPRGLLNTIKGLFRF
uniref:DUF7748 domain-containing protein n=2 Tax=Physcomitrium patens TaxID=3218 RepID=A9SV70_PHYPA|nr:hypothetical protein PHYPA_015249 [Physcomitrium patens]